jgi:hypothetical protein
MIIRNQITRKKFAAEVEAVIPNALADKGAKEPTRRTARPYATGRRR